MKLADPVWSVWEDTDGASSWPSNAATNAWDDADIAFAFIVALSISEIGFAGSWAGSWFADAGRPWSQSLGDYGRLHMFAGYSSMPSKPVFTTVNDPEELLLLMGLAVFADPESYSSLGTGFAPLEPHQDYQTGGSRSVAISSSGSSPQMCAGFEVAASVGTTSHSGFTLASALNGWTAIDGTITSGGVGELAAYIAPINIGAGEFGVSTLAGDCYFPTYNTTSGNDVLRAGFALPTAFSPYGGGGTSRVNQIV